MINKAKNWVALSSLFLLLGIWYVSTQNGIAKEKESIEKDHSEHLVEIQKKEELVKILKDNDLVLVDFHATWCPPCRKLKPTIHGLAEKYKGKVAVTAVDTDKNKQLAREHKVSGIPDVRLFKEGKQIQKWIGWQPADKYTEKIDAALKQIEQEKTEEDSEAKTPEKEEPSA